MAGPYWAHKDDGSWSIAKGEYDPEWENAQAVAFREFLEEVGRPAPDGELIELDEVTLPSGKRIRTFAVHTEEELVFVSSNLFEMQWPPGSGQLRSFPETDGAAWFSLDVAQVKIVGGQRPIVEAFSRVFGV